MIKGKFIFWKSLASHEYWLSITGKETFFCTVLRKHSYMVHRKFLSQQKTCVFLQVNKVDRFGCPTRWSQGTRWLRSSLFTEVYEECALVICKYYAIWQKTLSILGWWWWCLGTNPLLILKDNCTKHLLPIKLSIVANTNLKNIPIIPPRKSSV